MHAFTYVCTYVHDFEENTRHVCILDICFSDLNNFLLIMMTLYVNIEKVFICADSILISKFQLIENPNLYSVQLTNPSDNRVID
jgi:hypothetical protein